MQFKYILLTVLVTIAAFAGGAYWGEKKLWPYQFMIDQVEMAALKGRIFPPSPVVESSFTTLALSTFLVGTEMSDKRRGGGIYAFDNKVLIMSFRGEFFLYQNVIGMKSVKKLNISIDNGYLEFQDFTAANHLDTKKAAEAFRFTDIVYHREDTPPSLLVSHHQWHKDRECFTLRLSKLDLIPDQLLESVSARAEHWQKIYDTTPCLQMKTKTTSFAGRESGGRMVLENADFVLLSVGDHGFDGWNSNHIHAQDQSSDFGKIIRINLRSGTASHVSIGHRNPQGLLIDKDGIIWSTEHGPQGGDELNIIRQNENYGWPSVTYGSHYGGQRWPLSEYQNRHDEYARPIFAWIPAIGVSNVIQVTGFLPEWDGDLLVSSLKHKTLHRIRYRDERIIFDEAIRIGLRIRDLDQMSDGTIVLWTDETLLVEIIANESAVTNITDSDSMP